MDNIEIRRRILRFLYEETDKNPDDPIEVNDLANKLGLSTKKLQGNLKYLGDPQKRFIELKKTVAPGGRVFNFVEITSAGIDLLDSPNEFNNQFPPQVIYHFGDRYAVTIGDNATDVIVGKDIISLQFGSKQDLEQVFQGYIASVIENNSLSENEMSDFEIQLKYLRDLLQNKELDLGEVQRIKKLLIDMEGGSIGATIGLFSHPSIVNPIRQAVEELIGHS